MTSDDDLEIKACTPIPLNARGFNPDAKIPYGCTPDHIRAAMEEFIEFLGFINNQLRSRKIPRLEAFLMPANFSSLVGEFMNITIPKHCLTLSKNNYHNGHPDLIPKGKFQKDAVQYDTVGIEIKASRHDSGWQGHNPENVWLMVFVFDSNTARDTLNEIPPKSFRFKAVYGAQLEKEDWKFSGRSDTSRRTITASVTRIGYKKMAGNWIYHDATDKE